MRGYIRFRHGAIGLHRRKLDESYKSLGHLWVCVVVRHSLIQRHGERHTNQQLVMSLQAVRDNSILPWSSSRPGLTRMSASYIEPHSIALKPLTSGLLASPPRSQQHE